jgi:hypothetical protein
MAGRKPKYMGVNIGRVTVLGKYDNENYNCLCQCGNHTIISRPMVRKGSPDLSCGCSSYARTINFIGKQFEEVTETGVVLWQVTGRKERLPEHEQRTRKNSVYWICKNEAGSRKEIPCSEVNKLVMWYELRVYVTRIYGGRCSCCSEENWRFLTLDHVNNDGNEHRANGPGKDLWEWAKKNGCPPSLQLVCWNCNMAKSVYGICPHKFQNAIMPEVSPRIRKKWVRSQQRWNPIV